MEHNNLFNIGDKVFYDCDVEVDGTTCEHCGSYYSVYETFEAEGIVTSVWANHVKGGTVGYTYEVDDTLVFNETALRKEGKDGDN